jgi:molybdopterin-binding protein
VRSKKLSRSSMLAAAAGGSMLTATIAAESADDLKLPTGYRTGTATKQAYPVFSKSSRPISMRRISLVPAPIS